LDHNDCSEPLFGAEQVLGEERGLLHDTDIRFGVAFTCLGGAAGGIRDEGSTPTAILHPRDRRISNRLVLVGLRQVATESEDGCAGGESHGVKATEPL